MFFTLFSLVSCGLFGSSDPLFKNDVKGNWTLTIKRPFDEEDEEEILYLEVVNQSILSLYKDINHTELIKQDEITFVDEYTFLYHDVEFKAVPDDGHFYLRAVVDNYYVKIIYPSRRWFFTLIDMETGEVTEVTATFIPPPPTFLERYAQIFTFLPMGAVMLWMMYSSKKDQQKQDRIQRMKEARRKKQLKKLEEEEEANEEEEKGNNEEEQEGEKNGEEEQEKEEKNEEEEKKEEGKVE